MFFAPATRPFSPRFDDRSFERFVNQAFSSVSTARQGVKIEQDDTSWTLSLDVPGLSREELLSRLSKNLPEAVDKYTPEGRIPAPADFSRS